MSIWTSLILDPLINLLMFVYQALGGNLGIAIIAVTLIVRLSLIPLTTPGMKSAQRIQEIKPELDKLKKKHKDDKQALAQAQMELYKQKGINPLGGILPMILQFVVLIGLFQAFNMILSQDMTTQTINQHLYGFLQLPQDLQLDPQFFFWNLTSPDVIQLANPITIVGLTISAVPGVLLTASAVIQFISSKFMMIKPTTKDKKQTKKTDEPDMAGMMQKQMMYMMPVMTLLIGLRFPAGLVLYWLTFSIVMIIQQTIIKKQTTQPTKITKK